MQKAFQGVLSHALPRSQCKAQGESDSVLQATSPARPGGARFSSFRGCWVLHF